MTTTLNPTVASAGEAIAQVTAAAEALGRAVSNESWLEAERAAKKRDAILRLMQTENPLTKKPHSASSAEAVVETDAEYGDHVAAQRVAAVETIFRRAEYEAAKLTARLAVAVVSGED